MIKFNNELCDTYKEILVLDQQLTKERIPHKTSRLLDGWQILIYNERRECIYLVVETRASIGHQVDLIEAGLSNSGVGFIGRPEGCLTAEVVMKKIREITT